MTTFNYDSMPVAVFGNLDGSTRVSLLDVLRQAYGDEVNDIKNITISYRDERYLTEANPDFSYWTPGVPHITRVLNNGVDIGGNPTSITNTLTVDSAHFKDISIAVGNNIAPNIYASVDWGSNSSGEHHMQELTIQALPDQFKTAAAFDGAPTPADVVAMAQQVDNIFLGFPNANDCHFIAQGIAAAAGATLDPATQSLNPADNEEGGFWRIAYRGSDSATPVADWQTLVNPGDIVRMGWTAGGFHTLTVTQGLNGDGRHPGQIEVVDNTDGLHGGIIGAHWVDYDGNQTMPGSITIYRLAADQKYLTNGTAQADSIVGTVYSDDIRAGRGDDTIHVAYHDGQKDVDSLNGGRGSDTVDFTHSSAGVTVALDATGGGDVHLHDSTGQKVATLVSIENLTGSSEADHLTGNDGANRIDGGEGNDVIHGNGGSDVIHGGGGNDILSGGFASRTQATGADGNNVIYGDAGNDTIKVLWGNNEVHGGADNDTLSFAEVQTNLDVDLASGSTTYTEGGSWVNPNGLGGGGFAGQYKVTYDGFENLTGGSGSDKLTGDGGNNVIVGGEGNDVIHGGDGNDTLSGGFATRAESRGSDGSDELFGDAGNDTFKAGFGDLKVHGGADNDTLSFADIKTDLVVDMASGSTTYNEGGSWVDPNGHGGGGFAGIYKVSWDGVENITGGSGKDTITGDGNANVLIGNDGDDVIHGGGGNDVIWGGVATRAESRGNDGNDVIYGDAGDDTINVMFGNKEVHGGADNDTLSFAAVKSDLVLDLAAGSTNYSDGSGWTNPDGLGGGGFGGMYKVTWDGVENLTGGSGKDTITGDGGDNVLIGNAGDDVIHGGAGNDTISGGYATRAESHGDDGKDVIFGDAGNDTINVLFGNKEVHGGADNDTLSFSQVKTDLVLDLAAGNTSYTEGGGWTNPDGLGGGGFGGMYKVTWDGVENLTGGSGKDTITGDGGDNVLIGNGGDDVIHGGAGNDTISGGYATRAESHGDDGKNVIFGDAGNDTINVLFGDTEVHGGADNDTLSFSQVKTDLVLDLAAGSTTYTEGGGWTNPDGLGGGGFAGQYKVTWDGVENLTGGSGSDSLKGDAGNNKLDGGAGDDTAVFTGNRSDYEITVKDGTATITDLRTGAHDGSDTITNIEHVKFADGTVNYDDLKIAKAVADVAGVAVAPKNAPVAPDQGGNTGNHDPAAGDHTVGNGFGGNGTGDVGDVTAGGTGDVTVPEPHPIVGAATAGHGTDPGFTNFPIIIPSDGKGNIDPGFGRPDGGGLIDIKWDPGFSQPDPGHCHHHHHHHHPDGNMMPDHPVWYANSDHTPTNLNPASHGFDWHAV